MEKVFKKIKKAFKKKEDIMDDVDMKDFDPSSSQSWSNGFFKNLGPEEQKKSEPNQAQIFIQLKD